MTTRKKKETTNLIDEGQTVEMQQGVVPSTTFSVTDIETDKKTNEKASKSPSKPFNGVGVYLVRDEAKMPVRASDEASCYDLCAAFAKGDEIKQIGEDNVVIPTKVGKDKFTLYPHARALVPTGIKLDIPKGYDVRIYPRSGIPFKDGISIPNSLGVIDSDYRGEVFISLINHTNKQYVVKSGTRLAQFEINKLADLDIQQIDEYDDNATTRSTGGFGSTGE